MYEQHEVIFMMVFYLFLPLPMSCMSPRVAVRPSSDLALPQPQQGCAGAQAGSQRELCVS